jgi:predicted ATPase/DNA-binding SARP family transcriptional activator
VVRDDLRIHVLGSVEIAVGDRPVAIGGDLPRRLLARLSLRPGELVPRDVLIDELWPSELPGRPADVLRVHLSTLRQQLRAATGTDEDLVARGGGGWSLQVDPGVVDHVQFRRLAARAATAADAASWSTAHEHAEAALALWRGLPFAGLGLGDALSLAAADLERLHEEVLDVWICSALELGRGASLLPLLSRRFEADPCDEQVAVQYSLALDSCRRTHDALATLRTCRRSLTDRGLSPGARLAETERRLLAGTATAVHAPSLDTLAVEPRQLPPAPLSQLLGRDDEVARLHDLLERHRTVQVLGLGGIGKTSVALETAHRSTRRVTWVSLTRVRSADLLALELARAQGWSAEAPPNLLVRRVAAELARTPSLVVLDECEHLLDAIADLVDLLVSDAPDLRILCTSRRPLPSVGVELVLSPLAAGTVDDPGPASRIVADRAGLDPEDPDVWPLLAPAVAGSGGLPLALELAGRRLRVDETPTGGSGGSDVDASQVVEASVSSAMDLLSPSQAQLLRRLAVLPDGVGPSLASSISAEGAHAGMQLDGAQRLGLLELRAGPGTRRLRFPEPVRELLLTDVDPGPHTDVALAAVAQLGNAAVSSWLGAIDNDRAAVVDDERANVLALLDSRDTTVPPGLEWSLYCWSRAGRQVETGRAVQLLLDRVQPDTDPETHASLLLLQAISSFGFAHKVRHLDQLRHARELAAGTDRDDLRVRITAELVAALGWSGDHDGARTLAAEILPVDPSTTDPWAVHTLATLDALLWVLEGRADEAVEEIERRAGALAAEGLTQDAQANLVLAASLSRILGRAEHARLLLEQAAAFPLDRFTAYGHGSVACELAQLSMVAGEPDTEARLRHAVAVLEEFGDHRLALLCRRDLGIWSMSHREDPDEGEELLRSTLPLLREVDERAVAVGLAALVDADRGAPADRERSRELAARLASGTGAPLSGWEAELLDRVLGHPSPRRDAED